MRSGSQILTQCHRMHVSSFFAIKCTNCKFFKKCRGSVSKGSSICKSYWIEEPIFDKCYNCGEKTKIYPIFYGEFIIKDDSVDASEAIAYLCPPCCNKLAKERGLM